MNPRITRAAAGIASGLTMLASLALLPRCATRTVDAVLAGATFDAGAPSDAASGPPTMVWPNSKVHANSDPWIAANHDQIQSMQPLVLVLDYANRFTTETGTDIAAGYDINQTLRPIVQQHIDALAVASAYQGYNNPGAPAFLRYEIAKIVDLRDGSGAVNSMTLPTSGGSFDYSALGTASFGDAVGIPDPANPSANLDLCGLFTTGKINEVWIVSADAQNMNDPTPIKPAPVAETKQAYDAHNKPIANSLLCTASACINDVLPCGVTMRILDFNPGRGAGCHLFDLGIVWQNYLTSDALPAFTKAARTFFNFDFDTRFHAPFPSFYGVCPAQTPDGGPCITWPSEDHAVSGPAAMTPFDFSPTSAGCGNVVFPPNATGTSTQDKDPLVLTSCENYGLHNGDGGADLTTLYQNKIAAADYANTPGVGTDCGGSQPTYLFASMPGLGTTATSTDGTPMHNWWVYLFY